MIQRFLFLFLIIGCFSSSSLGQCEINGIAIDTLNEKVYWTHLGTYEILYGNLDGSGDPKTLYDFSNGVNDPRDVAVDVENGYIYWTNLNDSTPDIYEVWRANLDGSGGEVRLFSLPNSTGRPNGLAIDPTNNKIYWSRATGSSGSVIVANLDGTGIPSVLYDGSGIESVRGLAIDVANGFIYWADLDEGIIRANLSGIGAIIVLRAESEAHGIAIDVAAGKMYWSEKSGFVKGANLDGSGGIDFTYDGTDDINGPRHIDYDVRTGKLYIANKDGGNVLSAETDGSGTEILFFGSTNTITWDDEAGDNDWGNPLNWDTDEEPDEEDTAVIPDGFTVEVNTTGEKAANIDIGEGVTFSIKPNAVLSVGMQCLSDGIFLDDDSEIIVQGELYITRTGGDGIELDNDADLTIERNGKIIMTNIGDDGIYADEDNDIIINGELRIFNIEDEGIELDEDGIIEIGRFGKVYIEQFFGGCAFELDGVELTNEGLISIKNGIGDGIEMENRDGSGSSFLNKSTGRIIIDNLTSENDEGIHLEGDDDDIISAINNGYILISNLPYSHGMELDDYVVFENNCGIDIMNAGKYGIEVDNESVFINNNALNVGRDEDSMEEDTAAIYINNDSHFINGRCGILNITSPDPIIVETSEDSLSNFGVITSVFDEDNVNNGDVVNKGQMVAASGFAFAPNSLMNMDDGMVSLDGMIPANQVLYPEECSVCRQILVAIPTMGQWALIILSLSLIGLGLLFLRQIRQSSVKEEKVI